MRKDISEIMQAIKPCSNCGRYTECNCDTHKTKVIFRKFKDTGEVIALFPELPGTNDYTTCESYMHIGQHSAASVNLSAVTVKATEAEYAPLKRELEAIGYNLEVVNRFSTLHFDARVKAINTKAA